MKLHYFFSALLYIVNLHCNLALAGQPYASRIILVGDSTMASATGYGDAFCARLNASVTCLNMAKGGRSSASYRTEGSWTAVLKRLQDNATNQPTYVLIQFGHNDQPGKPGRSTDLNTEFPNNITDYVRDVKMAGAIPVLVTPLTRRTFEQGVLQNSLRDWARATLQVAQAEQVTVLDLNADSSAAVQKMGQAEADTLAMAPPSRGAENNPTSPGEHYRGFDHTHLGEKGATLFSGMVAQEFLAQFPSMSSNFTANRAKP